MADTVLVLNGPNLNLLGTREPAIYGHATLADVERLCRERSAQHGLGIEFFQSNHEGALIDALHSARNRVTGCVFNPGAYTHTSVALHDAIKATEIPTVEVHISNPHAREPFRQHSYVSSVAVAVIAGAGIAGYGYGIDIIASRQR